MLQLRAIRKRRGMDAKRLAALLGVKTDRVYAWETERAEIPLHGRGHKFKSCNAHQQKRRPDA